MTRNFAVVVLGLTCFCGVAAAERAASIAGAAAAAAKVPEAIFNATPNSDSYSAHLLLLTEEPHQAGTPRNSELANYVRDRFIEYGLEEVHFHDTPALLSFGKAASLGLVHPQQLKFTLAEAPYAPDKDSNLYSDPAQVPFHGYALSGKAISDVVYANNGSPEDFAELDRLNIDLHGRVVMMRYSLPYSYRGHKVYLAEQRGAAATIIYSDPKDDGFVKGKTYPNGPWGPPSHIQWGAILYDWLGQGEPLTFHWTKAANGGWTEGPVRDKQLPRIPSMPLSAANAAVILKQMTGPVAPPDWQGGLPFTYHIGPGPAKVNLVVENEERIETLRNVIGVIRGREEPEKLVILGNHRDAWSYGAVDPSGGTAALLETARAFGAALRAGYRPRRTVVFANWDGEEALLGGSTQWVADNAAALSRDAVTYINVDTAISGAEFEAGATPALADFVRDITRSVNDPVSGRPLHDVWAESSPGGLPDVGTIVGATDYTAFQEYLGISCIDMLFRGPYGVYHSQYDNYFWMSQFGDPGFRYGPTLARVWGVMAWRLADAAVLPMRYSAYAQAAVGYIEKTERHAPASQGLRLEAARAAAARWETASREFEALLDTRATPPVAAPAINDLLLQVERALTEPTGLQGRPFIRHLLVAPQPTYRSEYLPRVWEAIDRGDWKAVAHHETEVVTAFDRASAMLQSATALLAENKKQ